MGDFELARPGIFKNLSHQVSDAVYCRLSILASTTSQHMYTASISPARHPASTRRSVAASAALGRPELVHLGNALLELDVLALFVAVSLVLRQAASVDRVPSAIHFVFLVSCQVQSGATRTSHFHGR